MPDTAIDPKCTALLIQDMQNELIKGGAMPVQPLSGAEIIGNSVRLLEKARASGMVVIYVVVNRRPDRRDAPRPPFGAPASAADAGPRLTAGSHDAEVVDELAPRPEDPVVIKHTTSPFNTTDIEVYLRRLRDNHAHSDGILDHRRGGRIASGRPGQGLRLHRGTGLLRGRDNR